jgi:hypothetical protein
MQTKQFGPSALKMPALQQLAIVIQSGSRADILQALQQLRADPGFQSPGWLQSFAKLARAFESGAPEFKVFAMGGNSKLPFVAFSTLPGVTCPGAGDCLQFCYSYRAWRYPAAFARQAQNAFLLRFHRETVAGLFRSIAETRPEGFDFRLYVDGDFSSAQDVAFWMNVLHANPSARAYGYSKSFELLAGYSGQWPANYMLNISSGHNSGPAMVARVKALPITRGEFRAVSIGRAVKSSDHGTAAVNAALRAAVPEKVFPCPGKCGACTGAGHACGLPQLRGRVIAIAIH